MPSQWTAFKYFCISGYLLWQPTIFLMDTPNSNIHFILTSSSSGDTGNVANDGEDISFNSLVEIYDRFKGFVIDMEIWSALVILIYFLHPMYFSTLHHFWRTLMITTKYWTYLMCLVKTEKRVEREREYLTLYHH